jgi:hypothetical protein
MAAFAFNVGNGLIEITQSPGTPSVDKFPYESYVKYYVDIRSIAFSIASMFCFRIDGD